MSNVAFEPNGTYLLVKVPQSYYDKENERVTILNKSQKDKIRKDYIQKGDKMEVAAIGSGCVFAKVGDLVSIHTRGSFELILDDNQEPFSMIRESEVIGKFK
jgi:hypothetical protein